MIEQEDTVYDRIVEQIKSDHARVVGRRFLCSFLMGYRDDEQVELFPVPPVAVTVTSEDDGLLHNTGSHMDPYWDLKPCEPVDCRLVGLTSLYTYGNSYDMKTGELAENTSHYMTLIPVQMPTLWQKFCVVGLYLRKIIFRF